MKFFTKSISCLAFLLLSQQILANVTVLDSVVAIVEEDVILQSEWKERVSTLRQDFKKTNRVIPDMEEFERQVLERMIVESIQLQLAKKNGIRVDDNTLSKTMKSIATQNKMSLEAFQEMVEAEGISYRALRKQIRKDLIMSQIQQQIISNRINVTNQDIKNYLASVEGQATLAASYRVGHILVPNKMSASETKKAADALYEKITKENSFESTAKKISPNFDLGWRKPEELPTLFSKQIQSMEMSQVLEPIKSSSGYHILKLLDKKGGDHKMVQQTKVSHILIKPNEIRSPEDAKQLITDLRSQIINGKDFKDIARTYSEDPLSATEGGDLGWSNPNSFVPQFEKVMAEMELNTISEPFLSDFGWHILKVEGRREENVGRDFQLNQARSILQRKQFDEELNLWLREIRQDSFVDIKQL